jgi:hypothetical protein
MSFYKEIAPFIEYIHSIRRLKTYMSFDMVFPTKWAIPKSIVEEGETVAFQAEDQNYKGISFVAQIDESNISLVLTTSMRSKYPSGLKFLFGFIFLRALNK